MTKNAKLFVSYLSLLPKFCPPAPKPHLSSLFSSVLLSSFLPRALPPPKHTHSIGSPKSCLLTPSAEEPQTAQLLNKANSPSPQPSPRGHPRGGVCLHPPCPPFPASSSWQQSVTSGRSLIALPTECSEVGCYNCASSTDWGVRGLSRRKRDRGTGQEERPWCLQPQRELSVSIHLHGSRDRSCVSDLGTASLNQHPLGWVSPGQRQARPPEQLLSGMGGPDR